MSTKTPNLLQALLLPPGGMGNQARSTAGPFEGLTVRVCVEMATPTSNLVLQRVALAGEYTFPSLEGAPWTATGAGGHISISTPARYSGEAPEATDDGSPPSPFSKPRRRFPWETE